ncbi:MAG: NAD(P)-dependent oxidoreductase [Promethearchaeota archaeon]|nr:MAG: NAD(P)-dependent oxidoreductase [Candidatus Lokiarchaeota archaeon]
MNTLKGKTLFITGSSRGIGKTIALRAAKDGANIAVVAKTKEPHPRLPGTVYTAVEDIKSAGGNAIACITDIRFEDQIQKAINSTINEFGAIDILINNASAINLSPTLDIEMKRYDLMFSVNVRGTFLCSKLCIPHLQKSENPHILNLSPPLNLDPKWFKNNLAYTMAKYGMSMCVLGMSEEFRKHGIAVNALWPKTSIATTAVRNLLGGESAIKHSRKPEIVADAAYLILTKSSRECTGNFFIDEEILYEHGITDLKRYSVDPNSDTYIDFFL